MSITIGIDLGTTNTAVSYMQNGAEKRDWQPLRPYRSKTQGFEHRVNQALLELITTPTIFSDGAPAKTKQMFINLLILH